MPFDCEGHDVADCDVVSFRIKGWVAVVVHGERELRCAGLMIALQARATGFALMSLRNFKIVA
jgi:hypothetical protein